MPNTSMRALFSILFHLCVILLCVIPFQVANGQITINQGIVPKKAVQKPIPFDSLENFCMKRRYDKVNLKKWVEQDMFFIPYSDGVENIDTFNNKKSSVRIIGFFQSDSLFNIGSRIDHNSVKNRYFKILDVRNINVDWNHNKFVTSKYNPEQYGNPVFLLKDKQNKEFVAWVPSSPRYRDDPDRSNQATIFPCDINGASEFIPYVMLTSYYEKAKQLFVNKWHVVQNGGRKFVDIKSQQEVVLQKGERWFCKELSLCTVENIPYLVPLYILENKLGNVITVFLYKMIANGNYMNGYYGEFITEDYYNERKRLEQLNENERLANEKAKKERESQIKTLQRNKNIEKYGLNIGTLISDGKVQLGMTQEMCKIAWGEPYRNNRTIVNGLIHEQWVYGWHHYLYFENGILTGIQD